MNQNRSVATIDAPQFINLEEDAINPGISKCEIKVFYIGKNRNGSYINKNVAIQMANSLPGTPIVGAYRKEIEDFGDHGHIMHIEDNEVTFSCKTVPYGFVAPDADVWFQNFEDTDEFGNTIVREYLMTTGYLWTEQYPEVKSCIYEGKGQSMELDEKTLQGKWATDNKDGIEFFIINDAIFTKLCILGDDVEPCFEGAAVTKPDVSKNFTKDPSFARNLFTMMEELKNALNQNEGGSDMEQENQQPTTEHVATNSVEEPVEVVEETLEEPIELEPQEEVDAPTEEVVEEEETLEDIDDGLEDSTEEADVDIEAYAKISQELEELKTSFAALQAENEALVKFKQDQDRAQKQELINQYFMLSDEDKADIVANIDTYSYDEIKSKLCVLYVEKNVDFNSLGETSATPAVEEVEEEDDPITTFSLDDNQGAGFVPPAVSLLREVKASN